MRYILTGLVFTGFSDQDPAEAVLIEGNKITYVGGFDEAYEKSHGGAHILDHSGSLVTPGLIDSHCHLSLLGLYSEIGVSLLDAQSIDDIVAKLSQAAAKTRGQWLFAYGLDESRLVERRLPTRWDLDRASRETPIVVEHVSGHLLVANSKALEKAGIAKGKSLSVKGGLVEVDEDGEPTGVLYDAAMELVLRLLPAPPRDSWFKGVERAQQLWLAKGFTGVEDVGTFGAWDPIAEAYQSLHSAGRLVLRSRIGYAVRDASELPLALEKITEIRETDRLRAGLVKAFYDGSGFARTGLLYDDWCKDFKKLRGNKGIRVLSKEAIQYILRESIERGIRVTIHTIGDRAVDEVLEAYQGLGLVSKACSLSLVHAILVSEKGLQRLRDTGACIKTQAGFMYSHGHVYAANLCAERAKRAFPLRSLLSSGVVVANSTDAPFVGSPSPNEGLIGAVFREPRLGPRGVFGREESLSFREALETYTRYAAIATGWIDLVGTIEPGKRADMVVWNIGSLNPSIRELEEMRPSLVLVDGRIVYSGQ